MNFLQDNDKPNDYKSALTLLVKEKIFTADIFPTYSLIFQKSDIESILADTSIDQFLFRVIYLAVIIS